MNWFASANIVLTILLLLHVTITDVAARFISNTACLMLTLLAIMRVPVIGPLQLLWFIGGAALLFSTLLILYSRGYVGGGDVKLLGALSIGLPFAQLLQFFT